jgi:integrase
LSVYKRGKVYWYEFWFRGQRIRESSGLTNKVAAQQAEAIRKAGLAEGRAGIAAPRPVVNFGDFVRNEFLPWAENQYQAHPRTYERYRESTKPLLASLEKLSLDGVSIAQVEKFKVSRSSEVMPATVNRDLAVLRLILNLAIRKEYIVKNPVQGVEFLDEGPGQMRIVSHQEQKKYMAAASPLLRDVATLIVETGMRPEEVFTIRKENVHLQRSYLFIPSGKTRFARRNIQLTDASMKVLKRRLAKAKGAYLFPRRGDSDQPLTTVRKAHYAALSTAAIKSPFRLYDFRHTFGSRTAMAGVDLPTLKELMGHSDISTTMRYVHPTPEHKREAVRKLEDYNRNQVSVLSRVSREVPTKVPTVMRTRARAGV